MPHRLRLENDTDMGSKKLVAAKPAVLLTGGNPQIAKADGDAPVQDYIAAMPGWKRDVGRRLDSLVVRTVPDVRKAVRWNSPFYGIEGRGWFLGLHCLFYSGAALRPLPTVESKKPDVRYFHIHEHDLSIRNCWRIGFGKPRSCPATIAFDRKSPPCDAELTAVEILTCASERAT